MEEKKFIKENIVGRRESWKKRLRHYLRVVLSALLFGLLSAGVFVLAEPRFRTLFAPPETETVAFHTEQSIEETTVCASETETEPIEELVQSELQNYHFSVSDYESMMQNLKQLGNEAEKSLVEVTKRVSSSDFLGGEISSEDSYSGIILTVTDNEILMFTMAEAVQGVTKLEVSFLRGNRYEAALKAIDELDGLAVISVPLKNIMEKDRGLLRAIPLGNSRALKRGDTLITVGAPAGGLYSTALGAVSYLSYHQPAVDSTLEDIRADLHAAPAKGSFVLNTSGELVGWASDRLGESASGFCRIAGLSDFLSRLELLSNGRRVPYIGVEVQEVSTNMERQGIPKGIYVRSCVTEAPAYMAGIQAGDIIVGLNETALDSVDSFVSELEKTAVDDTISLTVQRSRGQEYVELCFPVTVGGR